MPPPVLPRRAGRSTLFRVVATVAPGLARIALLLPLVSLVVVLATAVGTAHAHNSLVSSDPADGAVVDAAPAQITWVFDKPVPLETMTVTLIAPDGTRTSVEGSVHGPGGDAEVITPLPSLGSGEITLRWRLVGPDGHVVTGRVGLTITGGADTVTTDATDGAATPSSTSTSATSSGGTETLDADGTAPGDVTATGEAATDDGVWSTASWVRWLLRYASYVAIAAALGLVAVAAFVWPAAAEHRRLRRVLAGAAWSTAVLGALQLTVLASDVSGRAPWASIGSVGDATTTDAGMALALRVALAVGLWVVVAGYRTVDLVAYRTALSLVVVALLATWAFAGHARSMRWPVVGVVTDVAHHAAAATWLAGLLVIGVVVAPLAHEAATVLRRFSSVAATCVTVLVVTGVVQGVRLVGGVSQVFADTHGQLLVAKIGALALMLALAARNRRAVGRVLADTATRSAPDHAATVATVRRAMAVELAIGAVVLGITAALVVSPPGTAIAADPPSAISATSPRPPTP